MSATDGRLNVQLVNLEINNVDLAKVEEINQELASEFAKEAESGDVKFQEVTINESDLTMKVGVDF